MVSNLKQEKDDTDGKHFAFEDFEGAEWVEDTVELGECVIEKDGVAKFVKCLWFGESPVRITDQK